MTSADEVKYTNFPDGLTSFGSPVLTSSSLGIFNIVDDFGADPTGIKDSSSAFSNAMLAANQIKFFAVSSEFRTTAGSVYFPPGDYLINTGLSISAYDLNCSITSQGKESVRIRLGAGQVLINPTHNIVQFDCHNALSIEGGAGFLNQTATGSNVQGFINITGNNFFNYTGCCIGSLSSDYPLWNIERNVFYGSTASKGVVLNGDNTRTTIRGNSFEKNLYHIKLRVGGNSYEISDNDFIRFQNGGGSPTLTDVWMIPSISTPSGGGILFSGNKFGNENLNASDYRVLVADEGSGTNSFDKNHATTVSTGLIVGPIFKNNLFENAAGFIHGCVYSYTPNIENWQIDDCVSLPYPYIIQYDSQVTFGESRAYASNIVRINSPSGGFDNVYPLLSSQSQTVVGIDDPFSLTASQPGQPTSFMSGSTPDCLPITNAKTISGGNAVSATVSPITDDRGGTNATTLTLTSSSGTLNMGLNMTNITPGNKAWIDFDVRQSGSLAATILKVVINVDSGGNEFLRSIPIPLGWTRIIFAWTPDQNSSALTLQFTLGDYTASTKTNVDLGFPRVYHGKEPQNFGSVYLQNSATFNPPSISTGSSTSTTIMVANAALGDFAFASFSLDITGLGITAYVSAANTVTVVFINNTGSSIDLGSGTLTVRVFRNL